ncbi:hypothetical protein [Rheinheimera sp.]|uniref:hypothetical protein n=1 Tax=Rheinheimera sp. TaxID=1869214 RepID=UPI004048684D
MYYFLVLTSPDKEFHDVDALQTYVSGKFTKSMIISELGSCGNNPHVNVVVLMGQKRIDNVRRGIMAAYYGPKLSEFESNVPFQRYGAVGKCVKDYEQLKNVCVYLTKEVSPPHIYDNDMDIPKLKQGMLNYEEHKKLQEESCSYVRSAEQLLCEMIVEFKKDCMAENLNSFIADYQYPPPSKFDFMRMLKLIAGKGYNLTPLTSKMKIYYIEFMTRLGNYSQLENLIDRIDEELTRPRN